MPKNERPVVFARVPEQVQRRIARAFKIQRTEGGATRLSHAVLSMIVGGLEAFEKDRGLKPGDSLPPAPRPKKRPIDSRQRPV